MRLQRYFRLNGLDVRGIKPHFCPFVKYYFPHIADKQGSVAFATDPCKFQFIVQFKTFPLGGRCPRKGADEGKILPLISQKSKIFASFISALRAAFGGCAPKRACGRSPQGEAFAPSALRKR